jgi:hypothetical protein
MNKLNRLLAVVGGIATVWGALKLIRLLDEEILEAERERQIRGFD